MRLPSIKMEVSILWQIAGNEIRGETLPHRLYMKAVKPL